MATYPNESFQIHNYSFAAIQAFILEVKKFPMIYKDHTKDNVDCNLFWPEIVRLLLENGANYVFTASEKLYWERIYRGLWMWMRHILTRDMVGRYLGHIGLNQNPKYIWLEYLKFLEPFIQLSANSFNYDTDLDPFIHLQVLSSQEISQVPYCQYMVYWKQFQETLNADTYYISICVHTMEYVPSEHLKIELEIFLQKLRDIEDVAEIEIPAEELIAFSPDSSTNSSNEIISEEVTNIIEEQLLNSSSIDDGDYDEFINGCISNVEQFDA